MQLPRLVPVFSDIVQAIVPSKLFDYIGSGRPILLVGPRQGDAASIVSQLPNSAVCTNSDVEDCAAFISSTFAAWKAGTIPETPSVQRAPFSRRVLAADLARCFDRIV